MSSDSSRSVQGARPWPHGAADGVTRPSGEPHLAAHTPRDGRSASRERKNLFKILAGTELDTAVGVKLARLSGDDSFSLFGAEIAAGTRLSVHYHREGIEIYYILGGAGRMRLGERVGAAAVVWREDFAVGAGDCFVVQAGEVHQLHNTGETVMNALFGCPAAHLASDRTIIGGLR